MLYETEKGFGFLVGFVARLLHVHCRSGLLTNLSKLVDLYRLF